MKTPGASESAQPDTRSHTFDPPSLTLNSSHGGLSSWPVVNRQRAPHAWPGRAALAVVALAGAMGLMRLGFHVTAAKPETNDGIIVGSEIISLWLYPAFYELAQRPSEAAACRSREKYRRYAQERGLEKAWYLLTIKAFQIDGRSVVLTLIRRPYEMIEPDYSEFPDVLAIAAGQPPRHLQAAAATAKIGVIPRRFLAADPREVIDELRTLESVPVEDTAP